jgi:hypothetical protein
VQLVEQHDDDDHQLGVGLGDDDHDHGNDAHYDHRAARSR